MEGAALDLGELEGFVGGLAELGGADRTLFLHLLGASELGVEVVVVTRDYLSRDHELAAFS